MKTFLDYYQQRIQPQIAEIDIFLRTEEEPYDGEAARRLLELPQAEWERLTAGVAYLTRGVFLESMRQGTSPLCGMFRRAVECGLPEIYTPEEVAYIFALPTASVRRAAEGLLTDEALPQIFAQISLADTQYRL